MHHPQQLPLLHVQQQQGPLVVPAAGGLVVLLPVLCPQLLLLLLLLVLSIRTRRQCRTLLLVLRATLQLKYR